MNEISYIDYIENDMIAYVNKCDQQLHGGLSQMQGKLAAYKPKPLEKIDSKDIYLDRIVVAVKPYQQGKDSPIRIAMRETLDNFYQQNEYYVDISGNLYSRI